ncbi:hypothetical protein [Bacillus sp. N1-1]|uniref:hypothetical protein n=1 Tax=Bacillus sp. N1-1 TaxID=2682541 RepID=UPI001317326B|nr:hypothetical protein [Bacillus sp. N1-1]QHA92243.1 hypothetical protein GNK04_12850 [Bacillus sp. N1-1]
MIKYKYATKYFNQHEINKIWSEIDTRRDVEIKFNYAESTIESVSKIHPKKRLSEDRHEMLIALGEIEIALRKIKEFQDSFEYTNSEVEELINKYFVLDKEQSDIYTKGVMW